MSALIRILEQERYKLHKELQAKMRSPNKLRFESLEDLEYFLSSIPFGKGALAIHPQSTETKIIIDYKDRTQVNARASVVVNLDIENRKLEVILDGTLKFKSYLIKDELEHWTKLCNTLYAYGMAYDQLETFNKMQRTESPGGSWYEIG